MRRYLQDFGYGNQDPSGPIDQFWLDGPLRISPMEQVEFLHRMLEGKLPIKPANVELVWQLLEIEAGQDFRFRGKTGLGPFDGRAIGWLVGYVERNEHRWIYATFVQSRPGLDMAVEMKRLVPLRERITRDLLTQVQVLPPITR
jgi:beta-lactamase class D